MVSCPRLTGLIMRIALGFFFAVGVALIIQGCVLQNPPKDYGPAMFVAVGALNLFASLVGLWGSYHKKRMLLIFIAAGGFSLLLQIAFIISLFTAFDKVVNAVEKESEKDESGAPVDLVQQKRHDEAARDLSIMRWVSLVFLFMELVTVVLAALLKWVIKEEDNRYRGFDDDVNEQRALTMNTLAKDIERGGKKEKAYDSIREKMAAKYGSSSEPADWRTKMKMSWT